MVESNSSSRGRVDQMRSLFHKPLLVVFFLLLITILAYGLLINKMGFYWDDWPKAWFLHILGPAGFDEVYAIDRPNVAWTYLVTTWIIGETPYAWQLFSIFCHWLSAVAIWSLVRAVWPKRPFIALSSALLFLVYPGFTQSSISLIYSHYFLFLAAHIFSLELMIRSVRSQRYPILLTILSILLGLYSLLSIEYFLGFELLRPLLLWWVINDSSLQHRERFIKFLRYWIPYLVIPIIFLLWRVFVIQFPTYTPGLIGRLYRAPEVAIPDLVSTILEDFYVISILPWIKGIQNFEETVKSSPSLVVIVTLLVLVIVGLFSLAVDRNNSQDKENKTDPVPYQVFLTGMWIMLTAGWPFWLTLLEIKISFELNRFTLPFIPGVSLILTGLLAALWKISGKAWLAALFLAILVGIGAGWHVDRQKAFQDDWNIQRSFLWQFIWRVPDLEPGTIILMESLPSRSDDESMAAAINWIYGPEEVPENMPYIVLNLDIRMEETIDSLDPNRTVYKKFRARSFYGALENSLVVLFRKDSCLRILTSEEQDLLNIPELIYSALPLSHLEKIILDEGQDHRIPVEIIGPEPERSWCYFFQKADLERQRENWDRTAELGDLAFERGVSPQDFSEYSPFIEGYLMVGRFDDGKRLSRLMIEDEPQLRSYLCRIWQRVESRETNDLESAEKVIQYLIDLGCSE